MVQHRLHALSLRSMHTWQANRCRKLCFRDIFFLFLGYMFSFSRNTFIPLPCTLTSTNRQKQRRNYIVKVSSRTNTWLFFSYFYREEVFSLTFFLHLVVGSRENRIILSAKQYYYCIGNAAKFLPHFWIEPANGHFSSPWRAHKNTIVSGRQSAPELRVIIDTCFCCSCEPTEQKCDKTLFIRLLYCSHYFRR